MNNNNLKARLSAIRAASAAPAKEPQSSSPKLFQLHPKTSDPLQYTKWKSIVMKTAFEKYGKASNCLLTLEPYEPPAVVLPAAPFTEANDPFGVEREQLKLQLRNRNDEMKTCKTNMDLLFGFVLNQLSEESIELVKKEILRVTVALDAEEQHQQQQQQLQQQEAQARARMQQQAQTAAQQGPEAPPAAPNRPARGRVQQLPEAQVPAEPPAPAPAVDAPAIGAARAEFQVRDIETTWAGIQENRDVISLWMSIENTHIATRSNNLQLDQQHVLQLYATLKQGNRPLNVYKDMFVSNVNALRALECEVPSEAQQAVQFIAKLDSTRYGSLITHYSNHGGWPDTVGSAYIRASNWTPITSERVVQHERGNNAVFVSSSTSQQKQSDKQPTPNGEGKKQYKAPPTACWHCGEMHWASDCPLKGKKQKKKITRKAYMCNDESEHHIVLPIMTDTTASTSILLDSQASVSIFKSKEIISNIRPTVHTHTIGGINTNAAPLVINLKGDFADLGEVLYHPMAAANVLSWSEVSQQCKVVYDQAKNCVTVSTNSSTYEFRNKDGHFIYSLPAVSNDVLISTVEENELHYSKRELTAAKEVKRTIETLGFPSKQTLLSAIAKGTILNIPFSAQDVERAYAIYGPDLGALKGKTTRAAPTQHFHTRVPTSVKHGTLSVDIMAIKGDLYLIAVLNEIDLTLSHALENKRAPTVLKAITSILALCNAHGWTADVFCDGEAGIIANETNIQEMGVVITRAAAGGHVPKAERKIRVIKERTRAIICTLPYNLPSALLKHVVSFAVTRINLLTTSSSFTTQDGTSPKEKFFGIKPNYKTDLGPPFGTYCQVHNPHIVHINDTQPRTQGCLALGPAGGSAGGMLFWVIETKSTCVRRKWTEIPLPNEVKNLINEIAASNFVMADDINDGEQAEDLDDEDYNKEPSDQTPDTPTITANDHQQFQPPEDAIVTPTPVEPSVITNETDEPAVITIETDDQQETTPLETMNETTETDATHHNEPREETNTTGYADTPSNTPALRRSSRVPQPSKRYEHVYHATELVLHIQLREALRTLGPLATNALREEAENLLAYNTFSPIIASALTSNERKGIIRSSTFVKKKYLPNGELDRVRARTTAGGHMQLRELYKPDEISAPTVQLWTIFVELCIAKNEKRHIRVYDIKSAYLNADIKRHNIILRLEKQLAEIILEKNPALRSGLEPDGTLLVRLDKALYGCVESAALWYNHIRSTLTSMGFTKSDSDPCAFHLSDNGESCTICLYVDDLLMTSKSSIFADHIAEKLSRVYGKLSTNINMPLAYLGMLITERGNNELEIRMDGFINDLLTEHWRSDKTFKTPASPELFAIKDGPQLGEEQRESFHTATAKILYLAKRIRPDLLTAVSFLCTRVRNPDQDDLTKLHRLLGYINGTKNMGIIISGDKPITMSAQIDASYAVHNDCKSHTGMVIKLGDTTILATSRKQKTVTKSSTEAELTALSDSLPQVIQIRNYMLQRGMNIGAAEVLQDNKSAIILIEHGRSINSRTRHFDIALYFAKDRVESGEICIKYCPTEEMFADLLTKPLQGKLFMKHRAQLLNQDNPDRRGVFEVHTFDT